MRWSTGQRCLAQRPRHLPKTLEQTAGDGLQFRGSIRWRRQSIRRQTQIDPLAKMLLIRLFFCFRRVIQTQSAAQIHNIRPIIRPPAGGGQDKRIARISKPFRRKPVTQRRKWGRAVPRRRARYADDVKRFHRILLNALPALSLMLCAAATILCIRSPALFDRVAWTNRAGQYWEVTTLWGDAALVRVDACPTVITPRWETYTFANLLRDNDFQAIGDGVLVDREQRVPGQYLPEWGRGFSRERGILILGPYARDPVTDMRFYHTPFTRWTLPLWFPALAFSVWPLIRITQAMVRRHRRKSLPLASRPLSWLVRLRRAIPSLLVLAILLMWWRGYWAMDRVAWRGRASTRYLSTCRGVIVFEIGPSFERLFTEATRSIPGYRDANHHSLRRYISCAGLESHISPVHMARPWSASRTFHL